MSWSARIIAATALSLAGACLSTRGPTTPDPLPAGGRNVLFVGNSLTYTNDLPATLASIGAMGGDTIRVAMAAGPNLALIDHLNGATSAVASVLQGGWAYVILQQGPTPSGICRDSLVLWTRMFDAVIRPTGAQTAVLMTWPTSSGSAAFFDDVRVSFQSAASAVNGTFLPAGEAWRSAWRADPSLALYGPDGFHPSPIGTFLTALEIYERVTGRDARTLPARAVVGTQPLALPEATIRLLQGAAHDANVRFPASGALGANVTASARASVSC